ncbi:MAG: aspartate 1-decarboxylase [Candidatus Zixiibacteriota bacterium]|nr:MAG: aspartate 1-decarboxylase [candidate division Zixibacteria bacterium]
MLITVCKSKIHRATVTDANMDYVGSITIDADLIKKADLIPFEKVQVANITNGERFETYVIEGEAGSGVIALNGAAARKGNIGDLVIIIAYGHLEKEQAANYKPSVVHVDKNNKPTSA